MTKPEKLTINFPFHKFKFDAGKSYQEFNEFFFIKSKYFINNDLSQIYIIREESEKKIIGFFSICCARIQTPKADSMKEEIDYIPSLLIGYLVTDEDYRRKKYGLKLLINAISIGKEISKIAGCRYVIVDAYTTKEAINFYLNLKFNFLYRSRGKKIINKLENEEKPVEETIKMYFDLRQIELEGKEN